MIFASTFFNSPSTGGDIRIRGHRGSEGVAGEGGVQGEGVARGDARGVRGEGVQGEIKPSDPPSLFGLWGIVWGLIAMEGNQFIQN